jgi:rhomboid protease GluP
MSHEPAAKDGPARIPARTRQLALDWSLVLMSQGIASTILRPEDGDGWGLLVERADYTQALRTLRQYQVENHGWPWRQAMPWPALTFDWRGLGWTMLLAMFYLASGPDTRMRANGVMDTTAVTAGQWWRIFTAMQLHADLGHLLSNLSIGTLLLGIVMARYGAGLGLLAAYLAGAGGNVLSLLLNPQSFNGLGASGMVMGALGMFAAQSLSFSKLRHKPWKYVIGGGAAGMMLFLLFGLSPNSDILAHFGGFVSGSILGALLLLIPNRLIRTAKLDLLAGFALGVMVVLTWWLALQQH